MHMFFSFSTLAGLGLSICVLQTEVCAYTFQTHFGTPYSDVTWFRARSARHGETAARHGETTDVEFDHLQREIGELRNKTRIDERNGAARNGHLMGPLSANPTTPPEQANAARQKNARASWNKFLLRRRSEFLSVIPVKQIQNEINQQVCRALPFSQSIHHEDCEMVVLGNNLCFGKCGHTGPGHVPNSGGECASCARCSPVKFTHKSVQLKCKNNTELTRLVTVLEECRCELTNERYSSSEGPALFDPVLIGD